MPHEQALFWLVVASFLYFDNLIFIPLGCELLRFGRRGNIRYDASSRITAAGKEVVLLNPLNPFDRGLITTRCFGNVDRGHWRDGRIWLKKVLPTLNDLSLLGSIYMIAVLLFALCSVHWGFTLALAAFIVMHVIIWAICMTLVIRRRQLLELSGYGVFVCAAEAMLVPAYLMNMGKRVIYKRRVGISALGLGLREMQRTTDEDERMLWAVRLKDRLDVLELSLGEEASPFADGVDAPETQDQGQAKAQGVAAVPATPGRLTATQSWIVEVKACLKP